MNRLLLLLCFVSAYAFADNSMTSISNDELMTSKIGSDSLIDTKSVPNETSDKSIRILDIGNSFTDDAVAYLKRIADSSGTDLKNVCIYKLMRPSGSYKNFVDCYNAKDKGKFYYQKVLGGVECKTSISTTTEKNKSQELFKEILTKFHWDKIIIHQVSDYSDDFDTWTTKKEGGYLREFIDIIKRHQPNAEIGYLLPHVSFKQASDGDTQGRWLNVMTAYKNLKAKYGVNFVIPYGTAIENLRSTRFNDEFGLCRDGHHIAFGLARYTAACTYYQSVLFPINHKSILDNKCRLITTNFEISKSTQSLPIDVAEDNVDVANRCAYLACCFWWKICNPEDYEDLFK